MKRFIPLSLIAIASIQAAEVELAPISVESTQLTEVSQNAKVSADLAQALSTDVPSIDMSRRSGIANDIFIRGQKRDNISIEVDGTKVCGACPNRMDPPVSHILASQIDEITVIEGPYDVETFGTMSGGLKITTKKPSKDLHGELNFGAGSWGYNKLGATISGGNDVIRLLVSASNESSDQYRDGNGDTLAKQASKSPNAYAAQYADMKAYTKKSVMAKAHISVTEDQELQISMTKNKSDDVLYANTPMDAVYDYSNIYSVAYDVKDITDSYKNINLQYYYSDVDHPMSTQYRVTGAPTYMTSQLQTTMQGVKLKNSFDIDGFDLLVGLDGSKRTWGGVKFGTSATTGMVNPASISVSLTDTTTRNNALFAKLERSYGDLGFTLGLRYDQTNVSPADVTKVENDYTGINANLVTTYNLDKSNKLFAGIGQANRVPDARELYIRDSGNQNLDQVTNQEIDLGYEHDSDLMKLKLKGFYSKLTNYIYFHAVAAAGAFENIDATIYGAELSASIYATDEMTLDMGASYKRGQKDKALAGQNDKDLADIAPLRGNVALNYEYANNSIATFETVLSDKWSDFDADNGEQEIGAWGIINAKVKHAFNKHIDFTLGVNNILDETYAQSNTYKDLKLVAITGDADKMLLNEPGRYLYTNLDFKF